MSNRSEMSSIVETLSLYRDRQLPLQQQKQVEQALKTDPEWKTCAEQLDALEESLQQWGTRERSRSAVLAVLAALRPSGESEVPSHGPAVTASSGTKVPRLALAASILVAFIAGLIWMSQPGTTVSILEQRGMVTLTRDSGSTSTDGDEHLVTGANGFVKLVMGDLSSLAYFHHDTQARLRDARTIELAQGSLYTRVARQESQPFEVHTPHGTVRVLGTRFEVTVSASQTTVRLEEGTVEVHPSTNTSNSIVLKPGDELTIITEGVTERNRVPVTRIATWAKPMKEIPPRDISGALHN